MPGILWQPLLLHPEADEPKRHLAFRPDGRVYPKDRSPRGEATIDICKLNRGPLVIERRRLVDKFYEGIFTHLFMFKEKEIEAAELWHRLDNVFEKMKRSCENHRSFSRLGWFLYEEFERFFVQRLRAEIDELYARIVGEAFKRFGEHGTCRKAGTSSL